MHGKRSGVATRIRTEQPAAIPVHCFAHSLNLCLQDAGRGLVCIRDALELCREIFKLIKLSSKRAHLFSLNSGASSGGEVGLKPPCPTRWTVRTASIDAVIKEFMLS